MRDEEHIGWLITQHRSIKCLYREALLPPHATSKSSILNNLPKKQYRNQRTDTKEQQAPVSHTTSITTKHKHIYNV
jgi:hypothetical protein